MKYFYVYEIKNLTNGKRYIGSRSCNCDPHYDLGVHYFSSSTNKDFMNEQKNNPRNFEYKVLSMHKNRQEAYNEEIRLLRSFNVLRNDEFYNLGIPFYYDPVGTVIYYDPLTNKERRFKEGDTIPDNLIKGRSPKISETASLYHKGKILTIEHKRKISNSLKDRVFSDTHKEKLRKSRKHQVPPMEGKTHSSITKKKQSERQKGKPKEKIECPYDCGAKMDKANMKRWHIPKCPNRIKETDLK